MPRGVLDRLNWMTVSHPDLYLAPPNKSAPERCLLAAILERSIRDLSLRNEGSVHVCADAIIWFEGRRKHEPISYKSIIEYLELNVTITEHIKVLVKEATRYVYQCEQQREEGRAQYRTMAKREWIEYCKKNGTVLW